jgi:hypothetical protein
VPGSGVMVHVLQLCGYCGSSLMTMLIATWTSLRIGSAQVHSGTLTRVD